MGAPSCVRAGTTPSTSTGRPRRSRRFPGTTRSTGTSPERSARTSKCPGRQTAEVSKRLPPLSWTRQQRTPVRLLRQALQWAVPVRKPYASTCDIRERAARGENPAAMAARFGIPRFLVEAVLESDSNPTRTLGGRGSSILGDPSLVPVRKLVSRCHHWRNRDGKTGDRVEWGRASGYL